VTDADGSHPDRSGDRVVPLAWYEPATYEAIKALMRDGPSFAATYLQWEGQARQVEAFFVAKGVATVRVLVDPREFAAWCAVHQQGLDVKGRLAYSEWAAHARRPGTRWAES
jgi:hypothetical protein